MVRVCPCGLQNSEFKVIAHKLSYRRLLMLGLFPCHTPLLKSPVQKFWSHIDTTFLDRLWHQVLKSDHQRSGRCIQKLLQPSNLALRSSVFQRKSPKETEDFAQASHKVKNKGSVMEPKIWDFSVWTKKGNFSETDKLALFFLSFWSSVFHTSVFQRESKTYHWE